MDKATSRRGPTGKQTTFGGLVLAFVIALYAYGQPILNERMGWNLPALPKTSSTEVAEAKTATKTVSQPKSAEPSTSTNADAAKPTEPEREIAVPTPTKTLAPKTDPPKSQPGPLADRAPASTTKPASTPPETGSETKPKPKPTVGKPDVPAPKIKPTIKPAPANDPNLLYGLLKDLGDERYLSPAGLLFTRGGAEGHRLDHLERHTVDDPQRPGKHGVFDGGMEGALATIERAYERALTGAKTTKEVEDGRTIYTVDMGSRVGFIGGRDGNRKNKPMARRVKMVLDKDRVITAYPL